MNGFRRESNWHQVRAAGLVLVVLLLHADGLQAQETARDQASRNPRARSAKAEPPNAEATSELDPSAARKIRAKSLLQIIRAGGPAMFPLAACSFLLVVFACERSIALRRGRVVPGPFVKRFLHQLREKQLDREQALALCQQGACVVAEVFEAALKRWGRPVTELEQVLQDAGERAVNRLRRHLRLFNGIATVSPLLGLLGTVFGMIRAFNDIATSSAMGRSEMLAGGISEALITTAAGLTIAIPALVLYLLFVSRVDQLTIEIDALGQEVVELISAESGQTVTARAPRAPRREAA